MTVKNSQYENEHQKITENLTAKTDLTSQPEREKIIVFGVQEKTSNTMVTLLERISHDKKLDEEFARKFGILTLKIKNIFRQPKLVQI